MAVVAFMPSSCQTQLTSDLAIRRAKKRVNLTNDKRIKMCLQIFDSHAYTRLQFLRAVSHAVGSEKMLSEGHSDADDDDDTEAPNDNHSIRMMATPVTTPVRQRSYQLTQLLTSARCVSWHRVIHASRWCRAVINASVSRVPAKCITKDAAFFFAARLSTCCCVCTNLTYA